MTFVLAHQRIRANAGDGARRPDRQLFLLHGIYGSARNWKTFGTDLAAARPGLEVVLVDLRNHGASQGAPPPHTIEACAADLAALARHLGSWPEVVCGHSFGGKVALVYARANAQRLETLAMLDSPPGRGRPEEPLATEAGKALRAMQELPLPVASRAAAAKTIAERGVDAGVAKWMVTNLRPDPRGGFSWHFDLDALEAMLRDYWDVDGWPFLEDPPPSLAIHCVRAARSDRFAREDVAKLEALDRARKLKLHVLSDAGHWLHVDDPAGLLRIMLEIVG